MHDAPKQGNVRTLVSKTNTVVSPEETAPPYLSPSPFVKVSD